MLLRAFLNDAGSCAGYLFACATYEQPAGVDAHAEVLTHPAPVVGGRRWRATARS